MSHDHGPPSKMRKKEADRGRKKRKREKKNGKRRKEKNKKILQQYMRWCHNSYLALHYCDYKKQAWRQYNLATNSRNNCKYIRAAMIE